LNQYQTKWNKKKEKNNKFTFFANNSFFSKINHLHRFILSDVHTANGLAENYCKQTLNTSLKLAYDYFGNTSDWDLTIDQTQYALNSRVMSNNQIPHVLMFGRKSFWNGESPIEPISQIKEEIYQRDEEEFNECPLCGLFRSHHHSL
jgi:hypothetical protein